MVGQAIFQVWAEAEQSKPQDNLSLEVKADLFAGSVVDVSAVSPSSLAWEDDEL